MRRRDRKPVATRTTLSDNHPWQPLGARSRASRRTDRYLKAENAVGVSN
jgi:hypothetical protein